VPLIFALACLAPAAVQPPATDPTVPPADPVSFARLEERVDAMLAVETDTDRRDRLGEARELMLDLRGRDPVAQRRVYQYLEHLLAIEERARPGAIAPESAPPLDRPPVEEVLLDVQPAGSLDAARRALAESRYADAIAATDRLTSPEALAARRQAVDGWAREERERAGRQFMEVKAQAPGEERDGRLREVRAQLAAINARFPDNPYAVQIAEHLARVDAEIGKR
jgi:hypothetical protein